MTNADRTITILEARAQAQSLAFGPIVFQAARLLWKFGILRAIEEAGEKGATAVELSERTEVSDYGIGVLCDMAVSAGVLKESNEQLTLTKTGSVLLHDKLTQVNVDFVHDVCYQGMFYLEEAIREGRPAGLRIFSDSDTIYQCVTELPEAAQQSWYRFDHYYSSQAFREAAKIVFRRPVTHLLDIGGNTGKWASYCLATDDRVQVTIADLPGQLNRAQQNLDQTDHARRMSYQEVDLLDDATCLSGGFDVVWMSQFLCCFSQDQITWILKAAKPALTSDGRLYILEALTDRQRYEAASYSLNATSLYFTAMANGTSRMYRSTTLQDLLTDQGYTVIASYDDLGIGHTLLECKAA